MPLLVQFGFAAFFDQLSILALLLGAVVHDMGRWDLSGLTRSAGVGGISLFQSVFRP